MSWVEANRAMIAGQLWSHLLMTLPAVALSFLLALPVAWLATRWRLGRAALVACCGLLYAIPSLPMFVVLPMVIGTTVRDRWNVVAAMSLYGFALMVRSATDGLAAVGEGARLSATALGYGNLRRFFTVELPLAGPSLLAGLRVVAVSTVSLVTVSALLGVPSLGQLFTDGFQRGLMAEVLTGIVVTVALAWLLDAVLVALGSLLMPWTRTPPSSSGGRERGGRPMNFVRDAFRWLADPANLHGAGGWPHHLAEHLEYTLLALAIACLVGIPLGYLVGHTGRGRNLAVGSSGAARALPSLGLVTLLGLWLGVGLRAPMIALVLLAVPSVLAGAYAGIEAVNPATVDAARAQGMTEWQVLRQVEAPLGLPLLLGGMRSATLQVCSTATLAAYVGAGGLGRDLFLGLKTQDYPQMLAASILVVALAIVLEIVFEITVRLIEHSHPTPQESS